MVVFVEAERFRLVIAKLDSKVADQYDAVAC